MVKIVTAFGNYHKLVLPIKKLEARRGMAVAINEEGALILPLVLDYLHWSPEISEPLLSGELDAASRSLWISGKASSIAKRQLVLSNWELEEHCFKTFDDIRGQP